MSQRNPSFELEEKEFPLIIAFRPDDELPLLTLNGKIDLKLILFNTLTLL